MNARRTATSRRLARYLLMCWRCTAPVPNFEDRPADADDLGSMSYPTDIQ